MTLDCISISYIQGYTLSCFEAVVQYTLENESNLKILSDRNFTLWNSIYHNNIVDFDNFIGPFDCMNLKTPTSVNVHEKTTQEQDFESILSRNHKGDNPLLLAVRYERFQIVQRCNHCSFISSFHI